MPSENEPNYPRTYDPNQPVDIDGAKPYVKQKPDGTWCVYDSKGNNISGHESEEEAKSALSSMKEEAEINETVPAILAALLIDREAIDKKIKKKQNIKSCKFYLYPHNKYLTSKQKKLKKNPLIVKIL